MNARSMCLAGMVAAIVPAVSLAQWEQVNAGLTKYRFTQNESVVAATSPCTPVYRSLTDTPVACVPVGTTGFIPYGTHSGWWNVSFDNGVSGTVWEKDLSHPLPAVGDFGILGSLLFCGTSRNAFRSTDSGASWAETNSDWLSPYSDYWWVYGFAVMGTTVFAMGSRNPYISADSGATWQTIGAFDNFRVQSLQASRTHLFVSMPNGTPLASPDKGTTWDTITCPGTLAIIDTILFAQHPDGQIDASFDNGGTWKTVSAGLAPPGRAWSFCSSGNYLLDLEGPDSLHISVTRRHWSDSTLAHAPVMSFPPTFPSGVTTGTIATSGLDAMLDYGGTFFSTNSGDSWVSLSVPADVPACPPFAVVGQYLFVGGTGVWRKSLDVAVSAAPPAGAPIAASLSQNYPNPFNPGTTIRYYLPQRAAVTLAVFDPLGRRVATLVAKEEEAGEHTAWFDGSTLASGVYFYRLQAGSYVKTMRLLLIK